MEQPKNNPEESELTCCSFNNCVNAMADETRQRILSLLQGKEMAVGELVNCFSVTQPTISHHLAILRHARLVSCRRSGQQVYYQTNSNCVADFCKEIIRLFPFHLQEEEKC